MISGFISDQIRRKIALACYLSGCLFSGSFALAQHTSNLNQMLGNQLMMNPGPNGRGLSNAMNFSNVNQNIHFGGPNVGGYTAPAVRPAVRQQNHGAVGHSANDNRTHNITAAGAQADRPRTNRPAGTQRRAMNGSPAPVVIQQQQVVPPQIIREQVFQQALIQAMAENVAPAQTMNRAPEQQTFAALETPAGTVVSTVPAPHIAAGRMRATSSSVRVTKAANHHSKGKKRSDLSYRLIKKAQQLFARNRRGSFDPAKCFAWN